MLACQVWIRGTCQTYYDTRHDSEVSIVPRKVIVQSKKSFAIIAMEASAILKKRNREAAMKNRARVKTERAAMIAENEALKAQVRDLQAQLELSRVKLANAEKAVQNCGSQLLLLANQAQTYASETIGRSMQYSDGGGLFSSTADADDVFTPLGL